MTDQPNYFSLERKFKANKQRTFDAFANAEAMGQWWGPVGMKVTVFSLDFRPGGKFHYKMQNDNNIMWGLFVYKNIIRPDLIEFVNSFSDASGNITKPPFDIDFPQEVFNKLTFTEDRGTTTIRLEAYPINATKQQEAVYYSITQSMEEGFSGTFDQLEKFLADQNSH